MSIAAQIKQFSTCEAYGQRLVILTNTLINEVDSILVAPLQIHEGQLLISGLQIPVILNKETYFVDLLDIASVSKRQMKAIQDNSLIAYSAEIKAGINLLIDGF